MLATIILTIAIFGLLFLGLGLKLFLTGKAIKRSCKATSEIVGGRDMCMCARVTKPECEASPAGLDGCQAPPHDGE